MRDAVLLVLSTWPDAEIARKISEELVSAGFAACANIGAEVESIYSWEGKLETSREVLVLFKTTAAAYPKLEEKLRSLHPYDVPEIIAVPITRGLEDYLDWVGQNCVA